MLVSFGVETFRFVINKKELYNKKHMLCKTHGEKHFGQLRFGQLTIWRLCFEELSWNHFFCLIFILQMRPRLIEFNANYPLQQILTIAAETNVKRSILIGTAKQISISSVLLKRKVFKIANINDQNVIH